MENPMDEQELIEKCRLTDEEVKTQRPKPLDCGVCEYGECRLSELDKARCWARKASEVQIAKAIPLISAEARKQEREKYQEVVQILGDLLDADDCVLDHHGDCQAHGYTKPCPMPRGKELWQALVKEGGKEAE